MHKCSSLGCKSAKERAGEGTRELMREGARNYMPGWVGEHARRRERWQVRARVGTRARKMEGSKRARKRSARVTRTGHEHSDVGQQELYNAAIIAVLSKSLCY